MGAAGCSNTRQTTSSHSSTPRCSDQCNSSGVWGSGHFLGCCVGPFFDCVVPILAAVCAKYTHHPSKNGGPTAHHLHDCTGHTSAPPHMYQESPSAAVALKRQHRSHTRIWIAPTGCMCPCCCDALEGQASKKQLSSDAYAMCPAPWRAARVKPWLLPRAPSKWFLPTRDTRAPHKSQRKHVEDAQKGTLRSIGFECV